METLNLLEEIQDDYKKANDPKEQKKKQRRESKAKKDKEREAKRKRQKQIIAMLTISIVVLFSGTYWFAKNYYLQIPFVPRPLWVKIEPAVVNGFLGVGGTENEPEPIQLTDKEVIGQYKLDWLLNGVYMLESTQGKNDGCKDQGKVNGYGYRQHTEENKCYDTFEEVTAKVNEWFETRLETNENNLGEALCYYNSGIPNQDACNYSLDFVRVLVESQ